MPVEDNTGAGSHGLFAIYYINNLRMKNQESPEKICNDKLSWLSLEIKSSLASDWNLSH